MYSDYKEYHTDMTVKFVVTLSRDNSWNCMLVTCLYTGVTTSKQLTMGPVVIDFVK